MGIWIRSQNKMDLIECSKIKISEISDSYEIMANYKCFDRQTMYDDLAEYSSKEKALKVLDMIQNFMNKYEKTEYDKGIFQMPQDDEI